MLTSPDSVGLLTGSALCPPETVLNTLQPFQVNTQGQGQTSLPVCCEFWWPTGFLLFLQKGPGSPISWSHCPAQAVVSGHSDSPTFVFLGIKKRVLDLDHFCNAMSSFCFVLPDRTPVSLLCRSPFPKPVYRLSRPKVDDPEMTPYGQEGPVLSGNYMVCTTDSNGDFRSLVLSFLGQ